MLSTIHVAIEINGKSRKRPLRMYDATHGVFGVVIKGEVFAVAPTGPKTVRLHTKHTMPKSPDACRAAKLADLGIATATPKAAKLPAKQIEFTPELIAAVLAHIQANA